MTVWITCAVLAAAGLAADRPDVAVPNPSFEQGDKAPAGWTLSGGKGQWLNQGAADGQRAVAVSGVGADTNYWRSNPLPLTPSTVYRVSFQVRRLTGSTGLAITGPIFCNRDLSRLSDTWQAEHSVFVTPARLAPADAWLRFGQWHLRGTIAYDDIRLVRVQPVYRTQGDLVLGQGERVAGRAYEFAAPFSSESRNQSRSLHASQCTFNTNRWVFGSGSEVVYRHRIGRRRQRQASVEAAVTYYRGGELAVEASTDGKTWTLVGTQAEQGTFSAPVPSKLLPAKEVWVRLKARAKRKVGTESDPGAFQVRQYTYKATLDGAPVEARGKTWFVAAAASDPKVDVAVQSLGAAMPGVGNVLEARVHNRTGRTLSAAPRVTLTQGDRTAPGPASPLVLKPGVQTVRCPYSVPASGRWRLSFALGGRLQSRHEADLFIPTFYDTGYGQCLPGSTERVGLWWASSGWKIPRTRPLPEQAGQAVEVRAARNEAEAVQFVVRPKAALRGLTLRADPLSGPGGATVPASCIDILRVRYVNVTRTTDATGVADWWPDPLPPLRKPIDLEAGKNQPFWLRVRVARDTPAGTYTGKVRLAADGYEAVVPVRLTVYGFTLPDRMTCASAFGFSPGTVWKYQKITDPAQRRAVLDKYWANFSAHHISPYNPAPLDRFRVNWPTTSQWEGGRRDRTVKHGGQSSLLVRDDNKTAGVSARCVRSIPIPAGGVKFAFWFKTEKAGHPFVVTFNHHDAGGQWMSGRNNDMRVTGNGRWRRFERTVTRFPAGAKSFRLTLWPALYKEDGSTTGTVWFDDVTLSDARTGKALVAGGTFEPISPDDLVPTFDWAAWDAAMARGIDHYHFNSFRLAVQGLGGGTFHSRREPSLVGYGEDTPEYKAAFGRYLRSIESHLREKGWLDEAFVYWFDEPAPRDYAFVMNGFRKLKQHAPGLRRMLTEQVEPELVGGPNVWCPVSHNYDHEKAEERRAHGDVFWWYVCTGPKAPYCTLFIDHPATELRVWLWQTWQRKIQAILVWQSNYWTSTVAFPDPKRPQNPYEDPMGWVSGYSTKSGVKRPWGNGDGRFIYPPEAAADGRQKGAVLDGPVDSMRWEMLRDGLEDYEYHVILKRLLERKAGGLSAADRKRCESLLVVPESITKDMTTFTTDPAPIEARRDAIARAIEQLSKRP